MSDEVKPDADSEDVKPKPEAGQAEADNRKSMVSTFLARPLSVGNGLLILVIAGAIVVLLALAIGPTLTGSLTGINNTEYARGLITLVFSGGTMLIAILLILFVITSESKEADKRFTQGKEVLTLLIGVFGTILGFYFGKAEVAREKPDPAASVTTTDQPDRPNRIAEPAPAAPISGDEKK